MVGGDYRVRKSGTLLQPSLVDTAQYAQRFQMGRVVNVVDYALGLSIIFIEATGRNLP